jgi:quinol monooxygenase YgiN
MPNEAVVVLIRYQAQPGREAAARGALTALVATVVAREPDCHGITMLEDAGDPARILLYERWSDREAYAGPHLQTPHLLAFVARAGELFTGPPEITFWREVGAASFRGIEERSN